MSSAAQRRLMREIKILQDVAPPGMSGAPRDDNIMLWDAVITGPNGTAWEGGIFKLTLQFTEEYPFKPPTSMFKSAMFHPNVYDDDNIICFDNLEEEWRSTYNVYTILTSIQALLSDPNPDLPANHIAALAFSWDKTAYGNIVRACVEQSWAEAD